MKRTNTDGRAYAILFALALISLWLANSVQATPPDMTGKSMLYNDGTQSISVYLLMKVQWYNPSTGLWVDDDVVYQSPTPLTIPAAGNVSLDQYFNGKWNTNNASYGSGLYRVWAAAQYQNGSIIVRQDSSPVVASYNFTILSGPTVSSVSPANGSSNIAFNSPIIITFSESMDRLTTEPAVTTNPQISSSYSWDATYKTLTINPINLSINTLYAVTIGTGAKSQVGVNLPSAYFFSFSTSPQLSITTLSPKNNSYYNTSSVLANISLGSAGLSCDSYLNGARQIMSGAAPSYVLWSANLNGVEGMNSIFFKCADSAGNLWTTQTYYFFVDTVKPSISYAEQYNKIINTSYAGIGINASEPLSSALIEWNGANSTMSGSGAIWSKTIGQLLNGNYSFKVFANDSANNWNSTELKWIYVNHTKTNYRLFVAIMDIYGQIIPNSTVTIYNSTDIIVPEYSFLSGSSLQTDMESTKTYSIRFSALGNLFEFANLGLMNNFTLSPYFADYSGGLPASIEKRSKAIALNSSGIFFDKAKLVLPITGDVNKILFCQDWSFVSSSCTSWRADDLSLYEYSKNSSHLIINVTGFSAYMAGYYTAPPEPQPSPAPNGGNPPSSLSGGTSVTTVYKTSAKIIEYPTEIRLSRNSSQEFVVTIKNTGDTTLQNLFLDIANPWFSFERKRISLDPGFAESINVKVSVPENATAGFYPIAIEVKGDAQDKITFNLIALEEQGISGIKTVDTEVLRKGIDDLRKRIDQFKAQGINTTTAEEYLAKAESSFKDGNIPEAVNYITLANDALDKIGKNARIETGTNFFSFWLIGIAMSAVAILIYFFKHYRKNALDSGERPSIKGFITRSFSISRKEAKQDKELMKRLEKLKGRIKEERYEEIKQHLEEKYVHLAKEEIEDSEKSG